MKNRPKRASDATRRYIDEKAEELQEIQQADAAAMSDEPSQEVEQEQPQQDAQLDDTWIDDLTPYQVEPPEQPNVQEPTAALPAAVQPEQDGGTEAQKQRLAELYSSLEHIDQDVAAELHDKILTPELAQMRAELAEFRRYREQEQQAKRNATIADVNAKIVAKYPNAERILQSKEFMEFVNSTTNPYASDTEFNILLRAYHAGDAAYVLKKMDDFASVRGKPKPKVGVEPQQGGGQSGVSTSQQKKAMTDTEYLAKRRAIKSAPKGTYPPNAMRDLVNEYMNSRGHHG